MSRDWSYSDYLGLECGQIRIGVIEPLCQRSTAISTTLLRVPSGGVLYNSIGSARESKQAGPAPRYLRADRVPALPLAFRADLDCPGHLEWHLEIDLTW